MHAVGVDQGAAYQRTDHHQTGPGARRREHRDGPGQGGDPGRTASQHLRPGQLGHLLRRSERQPRQDEFPDYRPAEQHHQGGVRQHVRAARPPAVPRAHLQQHRALHRHVRHRPQQDSRRGRLHDGPRQPRHGAQLQVLHHERAVAARHSRVAHRHPRTARERHPSPLLCGVHLRQVEGGQRRVVPPSGPRRGHRHRHRRQALLRQERLCGRVRPHPLLRQRNHLLVRQEGVPRDRGFGYRHRGEDVPSD